MITRIKGMTTRFVSDKELTNSHVTKGHRTLHRSMGRYTL